MAINKRALKYFQNGFNCAQATEKAYQEEMGFEDQSRIDDLFTSGRGRAEDGICGALFAAKRILEDEPEMAQQVEDLFKKYIKSVVCWEIRAVDKYSCHVCVDLTCQLLEKALKVKAEREPV